MLWVPQHALGPPLGSVSRTEVEARVFIHDFLHWEHGKDYRPIAACPVCGESFLLF